MAIIDVLKEKAKADKKTIVLPESEDRRTYEAAAKILKEGIADIILVGSDEDVKKNGEGLDLTGIKVVDPATSDRTAAYIDKLVELRSKKGMTPEQAKEMAAHADGVIVGSAIVKLCAKYGRDCVPYIKDYVASMKDAIR